MNETDVIKQCIQPIIDYGTLTIKNIRYPLVLVTPLFGMNVPHWYGYGYAEETYVKKWLATIEDYLGLQGKNLMHSPDIMLDCMSDGVCITEIIKSEENNI